ncbi:peptidoglycan-binding domain-containing protein [Streptomyces sp. ADMS]|uniref:peptidoglycan-binding domain-containing protein n=1 Tax=Streptomyces sp. ADMS TaxID=3071415 RepID=UPI00296FC81C|nr:peptidoglycan-binding domain-containing protein [Streptomyces sp. ADMS]MDW4905326.1 peptidoglycan-binding domain-containing protein [Streptomyces sp. ADMS]
MSTPPGPGRPEHRRTLEPTRVLRRRRTEALAQLMREHDEAMAGMAEGYESVPLPSPAPGAEDMTQELPPVTRRRRAGRTERADSGFGFGPNLRRAAVAVAVAAAALVGFGSALLLPGSAEGEEVRPAPSVTPTPSAPAAAGPDGAGFLREGDSGAEVTELQERLLRIPDVYDNGATSGSYDTALTEAVARFQLWYGIRGDETGVYGDDTRRDLESRTAF